MTIDSSIENQLKQYMDRDEFNAEIESIFTDLEDYDEDIQYHKVISGDD